MLCFSQGPTRSQLSVKPVVTDSCFSLEMPRFPGHVTVTVSSTHPGTSCHTAAEPSMFILPLPVDSEPCGGGDCALYAPCYLACGRHWVNSFWILECLKCKWPEEMLVLYLLLKVVFVLCRFHVDKLSSAHVYLRLHKVTGFKPGFMTFSLVMSIISCPLSSFYN